MDRLWSPWRYSYMGSRYEGCVFCVKPARQDDEQELIVYRGRWNYIVLNLFPYNNGHLMIVPFAHRSSLLELNAEEQGEFFSLTVTAERALREVYSPGGINIGLNLGEAAGAGIAGHLHMHALPRWSGDANFMTSIGETRVLPEELKETARKLRAAFTSLLSEAS